MDLRPRGCEADVTTRRKFQFHFDVEPSCDRYALRKLGLMPER